MNIGIVGSEAAKFTLGTEKLARQAIRDVLCQYPCPTVISGGCHLGGIDIWAVQIAQETGIPFIEHVPTRRTWSGVGGYEYRNRLIARDSDVVVCITVRTLPASYTGMRFEYCYHCKTNAHIKSGGCWTVKQAKKLGKPGEVVVIG